MGTLEGERTELKRCIVIREDRYGIGLDIEVRKEGQWK